jgi:hypothetical protein
VRTKDRIRVLQLSLEQREDPDGSTLHHWLSRQQFDVFIPQGVLSFASQHVERQLMMFVFFIKIMSIQIKTIASGKKMLKMVGHCLGEVLALIDVPLSLRSITVVDVRLYRRHAGGTHFEKRHFQFSVPSLIVEVGACRCVRWLTF